MTVGFFYYPSVSEKIMGLLEFSHSSMGENFLPLNNVYRDCRKPHKITFNPIPCVFNILVKKQLKESLQTGLKKGSVLGHVTGQSRGWAVIRWGLTIQPFCWFPYDKMFALSTQSYILFFLCSWKESFFVLTYSMKVLKFSLVQTPHETIPVTRGTYADCECIRSHAQGRINSSRTTRAQMEIVAIQWLQGRKKLMSSRNTTKNAC